MQGWSKTSQVKVNKVNNDQSFWQNEESEVWPNMKDNSIFIKGNVCQADEQNTFPTQMQHNALQSHTIN